MVAVPNSSSPWMKRTTFLPGPSLKVACKWDTVALSLESYRITGLAVVLIPGRVPCLDGSIAGLPRARDRNSRVRTRYSLLHEGIAISLVNDRRSDRRLSLS